MTHPGRDISEGGLVGHIARIPLFEGLPDTYLRELAMLVVAQDLPKGHEIFSEGDEGTGFYVCLTGRVKIYKVSWEGKEQILHIFGPGEPFGEVPVFSDQPFPAHAQTLEESRVLFFPKEAFVALIRRYPDLALKMLAMFSWRLRRFTQLVEDLSLKEVPGRLAAYLLYLSDRQRGEVRLTLDITKAQLASLIGTIPETLSRALGRMARAGLIALDGANIRILDRTALSDVAETSGRI